jgi:ABC-2 type transport system ATP-binding protein
LVILSEPPALQISGLTKVYENGFQALNSISLDVSPGDFFALLGPNGAGKSTTIGILCSLIRKTSGKVEVFGKNIDKYFSQAKKDIGIVPQELNFNQFEKILDIVVTQAGFYGLPRKLALERAEIYLRKLGLWEKRYDQARMLSGGMKRRLMIARALIHEPRLLILDEPTAGVDIELRRSLWDFLREINERGTTIILTTHYLEEAENLCRNIAIIDRGEIVENTTTRKLLSQLNKEVFIFDTRETLMEFPAIEGYPGQLLDKNCFEVLVEKNQSLNELFSVLSSRGINIISMRNKSNRLEELFISMVKANNDVAAAK